MSAKSHVPWGQDDGLCPLLFCLRLAPKDTVRNQPGHCNFCTPLVSTTLYKECCMAYSDSVSFLSVGLYHCLCPCLNLVIVLSESSTFWKRTACCIKKVTLLESRCKSVISVNMHSCCCFGISVFIFSTALCFCKSYSSYYPQPSLYRLKSFFSYRYFFALF